MTSDLRPRLGRFSCRVGGHQWSTQQFLVDGVPRHLDVCERCGTSTVRMPEADGTPPRAGAHRATA